MGSRQMGEHNVAKARIVLEPGGGARGQSRFFKLLMFGFRVSVPGFERPIGLRTEFTMTASCIQVSVFLEMRCVY